MDVHYSAFISYRHHPEDIRVATQIQHALERFRIPRAIQKKTKGIDRLFRDKEELPITSDLNDSITLALQNSDFLIVICSVHTKESVWVQREIETFLKYHDRNRILTVLVNGEPYDVIPDILLHHTITDPATGETKTVDVEPLSCDWRLPSRKQRYQEELPRLAAALLGCSYDELRQRQRQYRQRRLIATFSIALVASLALTGYFLYNSIRIHNANLQIQENYDNALRNQSMYLTSSARERLENGDRLTAIALALAALPDEDTPRPYVTEAEYMLSQALGVYDMTTDSVAIGTVGLGGSLPITDMWLSPDGAVLCLLEGNNTFTVWDTNTLQQLGSIGRPGSAVNSRQVLFLKNNHILLESENALCCYTPDGSLVWQADDCHNFALFQDDSYILTIYSPSFGTEVFQLRDPATGQICKAIDLPAPESLLGYDFCLERYAPNLPILLANYEDFTTTAYCLLDLNSGSLRSIDISASDPVFSMTTDGKLLVLTQHSDSLTGMFANAQITAPTHNTLICYDLHTGETLWHAETETYSPSSFFLMEKIPGTERLLFAISHSFFVLDMDTGSIIRRCDASGSIVACKLSEKYATAVLEDGYSCHFWYEDGYCYEVKCLETAISAAAIGNGYATMQEYDNLVTLYRPMEPAYTSAYDFADYFYASGKVTYGNLIALASSSNISLLDLATHKQLWQASVSATLLGFSTDGSKLYATTPEQLLILDVATGQWEERTIPIPETTDPYAYFFIKSRNTMYQDALYYLFEMEQTAYLGCYDFSADTSAFFPLLQESEKPETATSSLMEVLEVNDQFAWLWLWEKALWEVDLQTGSVREILADTGKRPAVAMTPDGTQLAFTCPEGIMLSAPGNEPHLMIPLSDCFGGWLEFCNGELLALCDNGILFRFDADGTVLSGTQLTISETFDKQLVNATDRMYDFFVVNEEAQYIFNLFGVCNVIDRNSWSLRATVGNFVTYLPESGQFICRDADSDYVAFSFYNSEELIALAKEQLGGYTLSEEQKRAYGLTH